MMQRALYSESTALHYGLGKGLYSHFTSPIRRMSDLLVHQQLWESECNRRIQGKKDLELAAAHITEMERKNDDAYRAASHRFKLYYIRQQIDKGEYQSVTAYISKVGPSNLKVFIQEFGLYTTIFLRDFEDDYYHADDQGRFIQGKRHGRLIHCGDPITVRIADVNFSRRDVVAKPVLEPLEKKKSNNQSSEKKGRGNSQSDRRSRSKKEEATDEDKPKKKKFFEAVHDATKKPKKRTKSKTKQKAAARKKSRDANKKRRSNEK